jgi:23S rRNA pseudouridine1911/1915/1917 synthase
MDLNVLYEDNHLVAVDKPAGILSQGDISGETPLLDMVREYIKNKYRKPGKVFIGLVHRLDRPVSGVMVFARTSKAASRLYREFSSRHAVKIYCALASRPRDDVWKNIYHAGEWITLSGFITKDGGIVNGPVPAGGREASMRISVAAYNERCMLLLVHLLTGRKRQIRAQLAHAGMPVVGDGRYGSPEPSRDGAICLHASYLRFQHPTLNRPVELYSEAPSRIVSRIDEDGVLIREKILEYAAGIPE